MRKLRLRLLLLLVFVALGIPGGFGFARLINRPLVATLHTYRPDVITRLLDRNGNVFWEYAIQRRIIVPVGEMSPHLFNAIVAVEDARFLNHGGVDPKAIFRAALRNFMEGRIVEGSSTLTQQLAKQLFLTPEKTWTRKANEAFLAVEIEKHFTKDQIFEMYANHMYFGHGAYGVEAASRTYFGKHVGELSIPEAALIAGLLQRPNAHSPINNPDQALTRRNHVLRRMLAERHITQDEFERSLKTPIVLGTYEEETPNVGAYYAEEVRKYLEAEYGTEDLYRNGLVVETTLNLDLQLAVEEAIQEGLRRFDKRRGFRKPPRNVIQEGVGVAAYSDPAWDAELKAGVLYPAVVLSAGNGIIGARLADIEIELTSKNWEWSRSRDPSKIVVEGDIIHVRFEKDEETGTVSWLLEQIPQIQGAAVVVETGTGEVLAMVGGYDFGRSKFNRAVQSLRQPGSSFKPFVIGAAYEQGLTPADTFFDAPLEIEVPGSPVYTPRDFYDHYEGIVTIQRAIEVSLNIPVVKISETVGRDKVLDFARRAGISANMEPYPSIALGAFGVSPIEMAGAYNTFANKGVFVKPRLIRRINNAAGRVVEEDFAEMSEATSAQIAFLVTHTLEGVVRRGTGYQAHTLPGPLAGKTGTTNGFTDAWFVGFSPQYTVAVWTGHDDPQKSLGHGGTGAEVALPVWIQIFESIEELGLRNKAITAFDVPPGIVQAPIDVKTGRFGTGECGRVVTAAFLSGTEPDRDCSDQPVGVSRSAVFLEPVEGGDDVPEAAPEPGGEGRSPGVGDLDDPVNHGR